MPFALLHKIASYLLALSGFAALALSGELPPVLMALTLAVGAVSFFLEPSRLALMRGALWTNAWNVASLAMAGWTAVSVLRGEPFLLEGVRFLCFLLANKLCNRKASRDYLQVYVLSFLMLVAGTTLNTNLVFAPVFVAYVVCATWALTLLHLRREIEDNYLLKHGSGETSERVEVERVLASRRVVGGTFLVVTSVMSAGIFAVSAVFFFAFPRIGWNAFFRHQRHGLSVGFSDSGVALGENGLIKDNEQVVMRVEFPAGRVFRPLYFRGISFERYEGGRWTPAPGEVLRRHELRRSAGFTLVGIATAKLRRFETERLKRRLAGTIEHEIYLEPMDSSVLFLAASPIAISIEDRSQSLGAPRLRIEGAWLEHEEADAERATEAIPTATDDVYAYRYPGGVRYKAWSRIAPPDEKLLAASALPDADQRADLAEYLDVEAVPPRVIALARRITEGAATPAARAQAIQRFLTRDFRYSLRLVHDPRKEPIEEFLFDRKEGHCEYFASAMALLLRASGVPSRHVAGFYGGEWNPVGRYLQVRQRDAHAWVEAWMGEELGWVTYDPTPVTASVEMRSGLTDRVRQMVDVMELAWFKYVIEYDLGTQMDLLARLRRWLQGKPRPGAGADPRGRPAPPSNPSLRRPLEVAGGLLGLVLATWLVWRGRLARLPGGRRRRHAASKGIERALRALERRGCERGPGDTPREVLRRARQGGDPGAPAFAELVELYYEARFGGRAVDASRLARLVDQVVRPPREAPDPAGGPSAPAP